MNFDLELNKLNDLSAKLNAAIGDIDEYQRIHAEYLQQVSRCAECVTGGRKQSPKRPRIDYSRFEG